MHKLLVPILGLLVLSCGSPQENNSNTEKKSISNPISKSNNKKEVKTPSVVKKTSKTDLKEIDGEILAFYNVENLFDTRNDLRTNDEQFLPNGELKWTNERYNKKLKNIAKVVDALPKQLPVFLGMVEVENKAVVLDLINKTKLNKGNYGISHFESPDGRGIDNALIYRKDYATLISKEAIPIPLGKYKTRDILYTVFKVAGNKTLHTFVNHWPSRRDGKEASSFKREKAASVLKAKVDAILKKNPSANIVMMGDFNDYPTDKSIKNVLKAGTDTRGLVNLAYDLHKGAAKTKVGSHAYRGTWGMLDQIIISPNMMKKDSGFAIKKDDFDVFYEDFLLFRHPKYGTYQPNRTYSGPNYIGNYSDHLPVYVEL